MLERERLIEIAVAIPVIFLMIGALLMIASTYGANDNTLSPDGGEMIVGAIIGFILLLTAIGVGLAYALNEPGAGIEDEDADAESTA